MIEDDFYATIKFKSGEEIFAKVAASEEDTRTMLIINNPIKVEEIKNKGGPIGYRLEPWLKTTEEDMFIIDLKDVLTLSESTDGEMIFMHQEFVQNNTGKRIRSRNKGYKLGRQMGYISTVNDAKELLEKLYLQDHLEPPQR